jgi:hypothetical protein
MSVGRNDPCPCGSGYKYKHCCAGQEIERTQWPRIVLTAAFVLLLGGGLFAAVLDTITRDDSEGTQRVWSEEHKHWHNAPATKGVPGTPQPPGPAPEGKVWSLEHGHWHDAP